MLRPGVNADVRLLQQQHTGHAQAWPEVVKLATHRRRPGRPSGIAEQVFDGQAVAKIRSANAVQIYQQVAPPRKVNGSIAHLCPPPPDDQPPPDEPLFQLRELPLEPRRSSTFSRVATSTTISPKTM